MLHVVSELAANIWQTFGIISCDCDSNKVTVSPVKAVFTEALSIIYPNLFVPSSATMSHIQFKLCHEEDTRLASFDEPPTWSKLAARVHRIFGIPPADVAISYTDR